MSSFLLTVEGPSDQGVFDGLNNRLPQNIIAKPVNGNRPKKISGFFKHRRGYNKYIMCKDLHTFPQEKINQFYNEAKNKLDRHDKPLFEQLTIKYAIEAWFLCDINALNITFNCNITQKVNDPEVIENPDIYLTTLLRKQGRNYFKGREVSRIIIENMDLTKLANKSTSYKKFIQIIT